MAGVWHKEGRFSPWDLSGGGLDPVGDAQVRWQYVDVEATVKASGFVAPRAVLWPDGRRFEVGCVVECRRVDQSGTWHYVVEVLGRRRQMWYRHGAFFVLVQSGGTLHGGEPPEMDRYALHKEYGLRA